MNAYHRRAATLDADVSHTDHADRALIAARDDDAEPETTEIRELAAASGYAVVGEITQRRREDPTYDLGRGKAEDLMRLAAETGAGTVIYDGTLSPGQTFSLGDLCPTGTVVIDRPRLVLERFADAADSRAAELQLELARLRYELPRLRELVARDDSENRRLRPEGDGRVADLERRIDAVERALDGIVDDRAERRERRREAGFDLVALVGYANAGKSRLCRRLADDVDEEAHEPVFGDATDEALSVSGRPFETVSTASRRATIGGRRTVVTDTVGFVAGLSADALRSFRATLEDAREADCLLLVADASDGPDAFRRKLRTSLSLIGESTVPVVPLLNKADRVGSEVMTARAAAIEAVVAEIEGDGVSVEPRLRPPIPVSGRDGTGLAELGAAVAESLPTASATVSAANTDGTQAALSWAYDRGVVDGVEYEGDWVRASLAGRPGAVAEARRRLEAGE